MNKLKAILLVTLLSVLGFQITAQSHNGKHKHHLEQLKKELNLTDAQIDQFKAIKKKYKPEMKAIRSDQTLSTTEKKQKLDAVRVRKDADLKGFLSDDQFNKLTTIRENRFKKAEQLKKELNLSDQQAEEMHAIKEKYRPLKQEIKEDTSLSEADKKTKRKELRKAKKAEVKAVLSEDQYKKYKELKKAKKAKKQLR